MSSFITALTDSTTGLTSAKLWADVTSAVPLIILVFGFVFGYHVVRKILKRGANGRFSM